MQLIFNKANKLSPHGIQDGKVAIARSTDQSQFVEGGS